MQPEALTVTAPGNEVGSEGKVTESPAREPDPLCVDLDGTLIRTDTLVECVLSLSRRPLDLLRVPFWLFRGRAYLKRRIASASNIDVRHLPYNDELVEYLRDQHKNGRGLVLATAADAIVAQDVADYLGLFDEVIASDGVTNMKGEEKRLKLVQRFGSRQFSYAGDANVDMSVWRDSKRAVVVGSSRLMKAVNNVTTVERWFKPRYSMLSEVLRALRPYQWVKNVLVFVPIVTANALGDIRSWIAAALVFVAMSFAASGTYIVNDILDIRGDRQHPEKRERPFARGSLSPLVGLVIAALLFVLAAGFGSATGTVEYLALYVLVSVSYSVKLKEMLLVDLFILAFLYCLRVFIGGAATGYEVSMWLFAYSAFLFFGLACVKRVAELTNFQQQEVSRRAYSKSDIQLLSSMGLSSSFASAVVLALYIQEQMSLGVYARPAILWAIVPLLTFWQFRLWFSTSRGYMKGDPILYAAGDWVSQMVAVAAVFCMVLAHTGL
jgi:4-hydroxybenzoate polyprenyltransferase